ncbi:sulfotransferase [Bauldia litoralis]|nr:sulfotransferase [Bauldia litoralis]
MPRMLAEGPARGPDFICIGAQKGGTRWLFDQLDHHPQFWMPPIKELHYFDLSDRFLKKAVPLYQRARTSIDDANRRRDRAHERRLEAVDVDWLAARIWLNERPIDFDRYARLFNPRGDRLSGDICPPYAIVPDDRAQAIRQRFPDARIVYLARDPIARFWSQYCMLVRRNERKDPAALEQVERFARKGNGVQHSSIREVVARWRRSPDDDAFGLFFFDDLKADAISLRGRILNFLGADPGQESGGLSTDFNRKKEQAKVEMTDQVRDYLVPLFADEIRGCAAEFGGPALEWVRKYGL